jgi:hypothetical protein
MTTEDQNIAIAKACPRVALVIERNNGAIEARWRDRYENAYDSDALVRREFDPLNDLNAMHEAWTTLTDEQKSAYERTLAEIVKPTSKLKGNAGFWHVTSQCGNATAAQRAEAFLRTLNPWEAAL